MTIFFINPAIFSILFPIFGNILQNQYHATVED